MYIKNIGGWWVGNRENPKHWKRNTIVVGLAGVAIAGFVAWIGASNEVTPL
jgi:hypothetical protein